MDTTSTKPLTYAYLLALPEDGKRRELIDGTRRIDLGRKRELYATFGVAEYWMIDPKLEWVEVCRNGGGAVREVNRLVRERGDGPLTSPLFPGFGLPLDRLFR